MTHLRDPTLDALGHRIRSARVARGWSQRQLCAKAGVSPRFLVQLESGRGNVSVARLTEIAEALECSLVSLLAGFGPISDRADRAASAALAGAAGARAKISLVGLRGAGKSTLGQAAARDASWAFVEVDQRVVDRAGMTLAEMFEYHGPERYRELALEVLHDLVADPAPALIEVGGSLVLDERVLALLEERTTVVWLRALPEEHLRRVRAQGDSRPMAGRPDPLGELRGILTTREPLYARATHVIDTGAGSEGDAVARLVDLTRRAATPERRVGEVA